MLRLRGEVEGRHGTPWLLVNVAGAFFEHRITELSVDDWDLLLDTNLKGTFLTCKTFLPAMIAAGSGCIVNIGSTAGHQGRPHPRRVLRGQGRRRQPEPQPGPRPRRRRRAGRAASAPA